MTSDVLQLPAYPSTQSRKALPASQRATLYQTTALTLSVVLALPPQKRDIPSTRVYFASYAQDTAFQALQTLILRDGAAKDGAGARSADEKAIAKRSLLLTEKLAQSSSGLDIQTLLDLAVVYSHTQPASLRRLFAAAHQARPELASSVANELIPGLTALLTQQTPAAQSLYAQRKVAACTLVFLRGAKDTPALLRPFAHSKPFVLALAGLYDGGLTAIAASYGGPSALSAGIASAGRAADEWETIREETKVALLDAFHIVLGGKSCWSVMHPIRKEKIAEKHAFRGNEKDLEVRPAASSGGRGRGGPRGGRGRGGGGGRGGGSGGGGTGEGNAREWAWKYKNKASRGNHNRKRGHDKKMARAGAVAGPSSLCA